MAGPEGELVCGVRMPGEVWCVGLRAAGPDPTVQVTAAFINQATRTVALISATQDPDAPVADGTWTWTNDPDGFSPADQAALAQVMSNITAGACVGTLFGLPPAEYADMVRASLVHGDLADVDDTLAAVLAGPETQPWPVWQITPPPGPGPAGPDPALSALQSGLIGPAGPSGLAGPGTGL